MKKEIKAIATNDDRFFVYSPLENMRRRISVAKKKTEKKNS